MKNYYVYIMVSESGVLYVGMTNNIKRRVYEHKKHLVAGFTDKYNVERLVYVEAMVDVGAAINREKQIKKWRREKKEAIIGLENRQWNDLSEGWF